VEKLYCAADNVGSSKKVVMADAGPSHMSTSFDFRKIYYFCENGIFGSRKIAAGIGNRDLQPGS
jgi:hypothetical protein